ncbi:hypothetical protein [Virgibacillus salexigens]|uniref:hypothetical protein n=1 Tax=Virgibacillus massiliensis TaxID=1462526 RepID=UPI00136E752C|nr:hypothetical protein [Virgibacillus massiliensis]MYL43883.1 hypothetical protein [Virgibacillus massiliensis]
MNNNLTELEVENLRSIIGSHGMIANKLDSYAQNCTDPQLKSMLQKDGQDARQAEQKLLGFFG